MLPLEPPPRPNNLKTYGGKKKKKKKKKRSTSSRVRTHDLKGGRLMLRRQHYNRCHKLKEKREKVLPSYGPQYFFSSWKTMNLDLSRRTKNGHSNSLESKKSIGLRHYTT